MMALAEVLEVDGAFPTTAIPAEVTQPGDFNQKAAAAQTAPGQVDVLVNCAGASRPTSLNGDDAWWDDPFILGFASIRHLTHRLAPGTQAPMGHVIDVTAGVGQRHLDAEAAAKGHCTPGWRACHGWMMVSGRTIKTRNAGAGIVTRLLRVGIIGASAEGGWARDSHVPAVQALAGLELAAVATGSQATADASARAFGVAAGYGDAMDMVRAPGIDLVTVAVRVPAHHDLVLGALAAGKHVFCE